ncbi:MAG: phage GP46 family protein [Gallionella sp.]|nr:phage GP46 family protein [Gallionella sp.]MDD4947450.1 phage GP46 family protein [Gallionella sp.]MDD5613415.1 phage GP46 family protein [Gallionella sp.]
MLKLVQMDNGVFDLAFDDPALNDDAAAVETLVYAVLFSDAEAPVARVADRYDRRGWWAAPQAGSGLWHVRRQPLGSAARRETLTIIRDALTRHGLSQVQITETSPVAGSVSSVLLNITGLHNGRQFVVSVPL